MAAIDPKAEGTGDRLQRALKTLAMMPAQPIRTYDSWVDGNKPNQITQKAEGISAIASDAEMQRLDEIHETLANTSSSNPLIEDLRFLYLMSQRALKHEQELRGVVDKLLSKLTKAYCGHPIERVAFGRGTC